jgi:hypothetical protein
MAHANEFDASDGEGEGGDLDGESEEFECFDSGPTIGQPSQPGKLGSQPASASPDGDRDEDEEALFNEDDF